MADEEAFIGTILTDPGNTAPRLVYADWLEEREDTDSACRAGVRLRLRELVFLAQ